MARILVPLKRVPDFEGRLALSAGQRSIECSGLRWIMNPFDEIALEGALRLRETRGGVEEIVALSAGGVECAQQLRTALAMGADRAVLVRCESELDSYLTAEIIAAVYKQARYDMVIAGKQAVDTDANQTGQILAAILGVPLAPFASAVSVDERWSSAEVTCEVDSGWETLRIRPAS
ncbi:MAG TPA: electron transfer flavoprotein subunit beta/FixA family protein, partial [Oligoflexia bacterium]|nr:electron transfer flavoprotein subunit beta/FixA family protein [Oligoflexia bacterium]